MPRCVCKPNKECTFCRLYRTDARYRRLWGEKPARRAPGVDRWGTCRWLGDAKFVGKPVYFP